MCRHSQKRQKWGEMAIFDQFSSISSSICGQTKRASDFVPMNHHRPLNRPRGSDPDYLQRPLMASFRARNLAIQFRSAGRQGTGNLMLFFSVDSINLILQGIRRRLCEYKRTFIWRNVEWKNTFLMLTVCIRHIVSERELLLFSSQITAISKSTCQERLCNLHAFQYVRIGSADNKHHINNVIEQITILYV